MPIPFPGNYDTLCRNAGKAVAVAFHGPCPQCGTKGSFVFTGAVVGRGVVIVTEAKGFAYASWSIPLARCGACRKWARVLPIELLPRKTYGAQVIQTGMSRYAFSELSLRKAAGEIVPAASTVLHHSTLWH
jgi:hypothetical protein